MDDNVDNNDDKASLENIKNTVLYTRIADSVAECNIHLQRIDESIADLQMCLPMTEDIYQRLGKEQIRILDQLIYRYTKFQDKIGSSLIKNISVYLEGDSHKRTFIDMLNILEKHEIIESIQEWDKLRELRNMLTHEYDQDTSRQIEIINEVCRSLSFLKDTFAAIKNIVDL